SAVIGGSLSGYVHRVGFYAVLGDGSANGAGGPLLMDNLQITSKRPNILCLVSEDNGPFLGCYGDTVARTPTIDQLAQEGIRFTNAFANAPVCAVARFSLITGTHGTQFAGPGQMRNQQADFPSWLRYWPEYLRQAGYYTTNNRKTDYNPTIQELADAAWDKNNSSAKWSARSDGQPFFAVYNQNNTHERKHFLDGLDEDGFPDITDDPLNIATVTDPDSVVLPPIHPDTFISRITWAHVHDTIEDTDKWVQRKIRELEDAGLLEDTIIFYYSDHGGPLPGGKRHVNDFGLRVPLIVRIPENWSHLFNLARGSVVDEPVSFLDLPTTMLALAGESIPTHLQGRIAFGVNKESAMAYIPFYRNRMDERIALARGVHNDRYRYVRNYLPEFPVGRRMEYRSRGSLAKEWAALYAKNSLTETQGDFYQTPGYEELYDFQIDPWETNNLIDDPTYAALLQEMRAATDSFILDNRDTGFIPEGSSSYSYINASSESTYPLQSQILDLANKAASGDVSFLSELTTALGDSNYIVRFWGAMGCAHLGMEALPAAMALENQLSDVEPCVATAAAYALCRMGQTTNALTLLNNQILTEVGFNLLFALEIADRIDDLAFALLPSIQASQGAGVSNNDVASLLDFLVDKLTSGPRQSPYLGVVGSIPGRIEAEDFDQGLQYWAYADQDQGNTDTGTNYRPGTEGDVDILESAPGEYRVSKTRNGEFLEYSVNVQAGVYDVILYAASGDPHPGSLGLKINGHSLGVLDIANTGTWNDLQAFTLENVTLEGGNNHYLRLEIIDGHFDMDAMEFVAQGVSNNYAEWIAGFPGVGLFTGINDDPDGDGYNNGLENYFGTDPSVSSGRIVCCTMVDSDTFSFTHPESTNPASNINLVYSWSKDLQTFYSSGLAESGGTLVTIHAEKNTPSPGITTVTANSSGTLTSRLFVRLEIEQ
ncbi:MAG: sulfatase-like hydrolase/transferase, partial [Verrucomicrobiota bacterium]